MSGGRNKSISLLQEEIKAAHQLLEGTVGEVTIEQIHWHPAGTAIPLGASYAHVILSEDAIVNGILIGGTPLFAGEWKGKTGVSELPPMPNPNAPGLPDWREWSRRVKVELPTLRKYALAVYAASDAYLATLIDEDLRHPVSLAALGMGEATIEFMLINGVLGHAFTHCGEISCLKGLQGGRGYPF
ncbi:MAG: DinB family protein [Candidatus Tectomicrobia bacterium]|uniref:DinB family protein n=1 Tax=Tectimicrobiota bacterium TaxID=2528274 RepID=A0A933GKM0_UNCTE|nr:DinB family protein [Candidatus Tectomicrobia bacterium]